jgi:4'-phosphopantetheinyl transferase EntD
LTVTVATEPALTDERLAIRIGNALARMAGPGVGTCVLPIQSGHRLLAEEQHIVADAIDSRRHEFAAGRACARAALAKVACPPLPILRGPFYEPIWPRGFAGSISHDNRFAAAIAYPSQNAGHLGIDLIDRVDLTTFSEIASTFLTASESRNLAVADPWHVAKIFSAKEAAIKILSIRQQTFLDFQAIVSRLTPDGMMLHVAGAACTIVATFTELDGILITLASEQGAGSRAC